MLLLSIAVRVQSAMALLFADDNPMPDPSDIDSKLVDPLKGPAGDTVGALMGSFGWIAGVLSPLFLLGYFAFNKPETKKKFGYLALTSFGIYAVMFIIYKPVRDTFGNFVDILNPVS